MELFTPLLRGSTTAAAAVGICFMVCSTLGLLTQGCGNSDEAKYHLFPDEGFSYFSHRSSCQVRVFKLLSDGGLLNFKLRKSSAHLDVHQLEGAFTALAVLAVLTALLLRRALLSAFFSARRRHWEEERVAIDHSVPTDADTQTSRSTSAKLRFYPFAFTSDDRRAHCNVSSAARPLLAVAGLFRFLRDCCLLARGERAKERPASRCLARILWEAGVSQVCSNARVAARCASSPRSGAVASHSRRFRRRTATLLLLLRCVLWDLAPRAHGHTTDVCWVWAEDGQMVTFYVGTWHPTDQITECDVYSKLNSNGEVQDCSKGSSGCKFCPLYVENEDASRKYLFSGDLTEIDTSIVESWTCRGFCPATYDNAEWTHGEYRCVGNAYCQPETSLDTAPLGAYLAFTALALATPPL
ncbi:hypothetical protein CYMTET_32842 [Cymbomonas tetramitiformis]|uniref:Transmembrane protein n=1 Tax=Cymbomonas tetramitiformis TaxID=36881 RepID=A0AAE0FE81_9CHLO|nr:hypothetical protein CYMTET_32842 [Cymbomonas tetramitiformis]